MSTAPWTKIGFLSTGNIAVPANQSTSSEVRTGVTDANYRPVISVTSVEFYGNVNSHVRTGLRYDTTLTPPEWVFNVIHSLNEDQPPLSNGSESIMFYWKVLGVENVTQVGPNVTLAIESN